MIDFTILTNHWDQYLEGFFNTIKASLLALIGSFLIGTVFAVMRIAPFLYHGGDNVFCGQLRFIYPF